MTGASSGIGRAIAEAYAAEGAAVLLTHRDSAERAHEVADAIGGGARARCQADLATRDACERLVAEAREELGRLDVWVNNAGADVLTGEAASGSGSASSTSCSPSTSRARSRARTRSARSCASAAARSST